MSVISKNPFDLLGDDGDSSPAPAAAKPQPKKADAAPARAVPGSTNTNANAGSNNTNNRGDGNRGGRGGNRGGRGRGGGAGPRDDGPRNTGPVAETGDVGGFETPGGFDGERVGAPKKYHHGPDRHTRPANDQPRISGGHTSRGGRGGRGGSRVPADGGERRQFERRSGGLPDSQKKVDLGWGANEGTAELTAEVEGEKDAQIEEAAPGTPAPEGDEGGWGAPDDAAKTGGGSGDAAAEAAPAAEAEPEEIQKSFDQFLAERAQSTLGDGLGKKEGRAVNTETLEGKAFVREAIDDFFTGGKGEKSTKSKAAPKKEKVYIEFDGQFATPPGGGAGAGGRGGRGGDRGSSRGGGRGRGEGRGQGAPRGGAGGRGGARGGAPQGINPSDDKAFPSLGA